MQKILFLFVFIGSYLTASLQDKSAIVYYGSDISYPLIGIHDYIIVQPENINTYSHGFSLYKQNIYAYISIGELDRNSSVAEDLNSSWIVAENTAWKSDVLDINNQSYREFIFKKQIEPLIQKGFENFFFDTLDSYQFYAKTPEEKKQCEQSLSSFINEFHTRYPKAKLVVNRGFEIIDNIHNSVNAVLFESYYKGLQGENLDYKDVSADSRKWLDLYLDKIRSYNLDIIAVDYLPTLEGADKLVTKLKTKEFIPYVATKNLDTYGRSSKNAIKREVLTLINGDEDESLQSAHRNGAMVLEYLGYIQKLHHIEKYGLPDPSSLDQYAGVIIWLEAYYKNPAKLVQWLNLLQQQHIKFVFIDSFGFQINGDELNSLGIKIEKNTAQKTSILHQDKIVGFEIEPPYSFNTLLIHADDAHPLLSYLYTDQKTSTPAAITKWGGYLVDEGFMTNINQEEIWVTNPFAFFQQALRLQKIPVADPSTENGKRLLFTHVDGDGIMNRVEGNFGEFSGDVILNKILKKYKIPHSISIIGAEVDPEGLYPKLSPKLLKISKQIFALENVEPASHTFSHPFFWGKIVNDSLAPEYRLKVEDYKFSLKSELQNTLDTINEKYLAKNNLPKANTIFWSGDCAPRENALEFIYKHNILAINGGDTTISKIHPWISRIAPFGLKRGDYYQIYTGAQNENVFTNDWLGPFWGFKRVTQTFELTNSPRRLKPVDIYYHLYSGSKLASLEALKYVFNWALKQDVMPIYTSEYIPKVMDMYDVSMANEGDSWLINGMRNLKTIRFEDFDQKVDLKNSQGAVGMNKFENHTYLSLDQQQKHLIKLTPEDTNKIYMVSSNAKLINYKETNTTKSYQLRSHVDLELTMHVDKGCSIKSSPKAMKLFERENTVTLQYKHIKEATVTLECK